MGDRTTVPFDVFAMQVDVPVSTMVCDGGYGWTCGQCPLDTEGRVVFPNDLLRQTEFVCSMIERVVQRGGVDGEAIAKLNVYFCEMQRGDGKRAIDIIRHRFAHLPVIVPIPVPHFYYDGMMVEVDVFTAPDVAKRSVESDGDVSLQIVDTKQMIHVSVSLELASGMDIANRLETLTAALDQQNLYAAHLVSDHWFVSEDICETMRVGLQTCDLVMNPDAIVCVAVDGPQVVIGELTFSRTAVQSPTCVDDGALRVFARRSGNTVWATAVHAEAGSDLVEQTGAIMVGLDRILAAQGMSFAHVAKLTAHYVGGATADELHGNMKVRHSYYSNPGPASTGLPVAALLNRDCQIAIDVIAMD